MSALTSSRHARLSAHREYRMLLGLTLPLFVGDVALRWLRLVPERGAAAARPASFLSAVRARAAAVLPFAFMG